MRNCIISGSLLVLGFSDFQNHLHVFENIQRRKTQETSIALTQMFPPSVNAVMVSLGTRDLINQPRFH